MSTAGAAPISKLLAWDSRTCSFRGAVPFPAHPLPQLVVQRGGVPPLVIHQAAELKIPAPPVLPARPAVNQLARQPF